MIRCDWCSEHSHAHEHDYCFQEHCCSGKHSSPDERPCSAPAPLITTARANPNETERIDMAAAMHTARYDTGTGHCPGVQQFSMISLSLQLLSHSLALFLTLYNADSRLGAFVCVHAFSAPLFSLSTCTSCFERPAHAQGETNSNLLIILYSLLLRLLLSPMLTVGSI